MDLYTTPVPGTSDRRTCAEVFQQAGCETPAAPGCSACVGGPRDTYARMSEAHEVLDAAKWFWNAFLCNNISSS